ncbi:MAG: group 1 truncated hemoglobin [Myxococcaceae bacterium]|nr:group 1 truncated hemoglobin [Myxococcaceae bacterium]
MKTLLTLLVLCSAVSFAAEPAKTAAKAEPAKKPLFERLGGKPAIEAVIDDFLGRVAKDERINAGFAVGDVPRLRQRLVELVCAGTGGPCTYSGRDMKSAHAGMRITNAQFDALVGHLVATLDKFKVPAQEKGELLGILGPMRGAIVEE